MSKTKKCTKCGEEKALGDFYKHPTEKYGVQGNCKECVKAYRRKFRRDNKEKIAADRRRHYEENGDRIREANKKWKQANREKAAGSQKKWKKAHKGRVMAFSAARKAEKLGLFTLVCDRMVSIYDECAALNEQDGTKTWHVDHTIPLSVGGAHVAGNLQIVPGSWNMAKRDNPMCWNDLTMR